MVRILAIALLPFLVLAGCLGGDDDGETTTTSGPTTTTPPATGTATAVEIVSAPTSQAAGSRATVCFTVSGTGRVSHVAIHWDNVTHAAEADRTFQDYDLGAMYPNNQSSPDPAGYPLSPTGQQYCTGLPMPAEGSVFVVAHAIDSDGAPGDLSTEREIDVGPAEADIRIQNSQYVPPTLTVPAGETVTVQNVDTVTHTLTGSGFDTGDIAGGATGDFVAPAMPGNYPFTCAYHPSMQGTLTVTAA